MVIITYFPFYLRWPSTMFILVQQYISNTHVVQIWEPLLKTALLPVMKTPRVFRRNRFARHPPSRSRCLCKPRRLSGVGRDFARGVLPGAFVRALDFERSSFQVFSQRQNPHTILQSMINRTMIRLLAEVPSRKNPFFH